MFRKRSAKMLLCRGFPPFSPYCLFPPESRPFSGKFSSWHALPFSPPLLYLCHEAMHNRFGELLDPGQGPVEVTITIARTPKPRKD